jgi:hypothetical protein
MVDTVKITKGNNTYITNWTYKEQPRFQAHVGQAMKG